MKCKHCNKEFKRTDTVVRSTINGEAFVHDNCHFDWLLRWDGADYFTFDEVISEFDDE